MPAQSELYLALKDGVAANDVVISDGAAQLTNYWLARNTWAPQIPAIRRSRVAGRGAYEDVTDTLELIVRGNSAADAMSNHARLARLLEQADRWRMGRNVRPVLFEMAARGSEISSTASPLKALVLGRAKQDETSGVELPKEFHMVGDDFLIGPVTVSFVHRHFLGASEPITTGAINACDRIAAVFPTSLGDMSPMTVQINSLSPGAALALPAGYLLAARNKPGTSDITGAYLQVYSANSMTATGYTAFNDAANLPRDGVNVLRYTPTGTVYVVSGSLTLTTPITSAKRVYVFATVRNNSTTRKYTLYGEFTSVSGTRVTTTRPTTVDASSQNPRVVRLGSVSIPVDEVALPNATFPTFKLYVKVDTTGGSGTFDIDTLAFIAIDDEGSRVLGLLAFTLPNFASQSILVDHHALDRTAPTVSLERSGATDLLGYDGDPWFNMVGDRTTLCWLATRSNYWRVTDNTGALLSFTFTAARRPAYLAPQ